MVAKLNILKNILKRQKSMKSVSIPLTALQDDVLLSDSLFVDEVLQLEKRNLVKITPEKSNWYRDYTENREVYFIKLTNLGVDKVR